MLLLWLEGRGYFNSSKIPYINYIKNGFFTVDAMLTPKGTVWLTKILKAEYNLD